MKFSNYQICIMFFVLLATSTIATAQNYPGAYADAAKVLATRTVAKINFKNKVQEDRVTQLIALHYQNLNELHVKKNLAIKVAGVDTAKIRLINADVGQQLKQLQAGYLSDLGKELPPGKVDEIKDAMTNNKLTQEYEHFLSLLPRLKSDEKKKVYELLTEARDHAMMVLTNKEMNQWFAQFRNLANNYLNAQGYDLRKATEQWEKKNNKTPMY